MAKQIKTQNKKNTKGLSNFTEKVKPEWLFLIIGTIFGVYFVFVNPPWQSNDEDRHFIHSYFISQGYFLPDQGDNKIGGVIPTNVVEVPKKFQGIRFSETMKISKKKLEELEAIPLNPNNKQFFHNHLYNYNFVGYLPNAAGILIGQVVNDNPVWLNWWGRIGGLTFYLVIIFFAIKLAPVFKNVLMLYGLTPMPLYQGSSVTYDVLSISLTFMFFALVLKYAFDDKSYITWRELLFIALILVIHRYSKDGYPLIPFLLFVIPANKFKINFVKTVSVVRKKFNINSLILYSVIFLFCIILYYLPGWTWGKLLAAQGYHLEKSLALHKDLLKNSSMNIDFQLSNPSNILSNIFGNINHFRQEWTGGLIGRFGYSYTLLPNWFFFIHGLILITVAFLDNKKEIVVKLWQKSIFFVVGFGSIFGIIIMSYFYSPVGANMIFGLQGRYLVHAVPIILFLIYNNQFELPKWKARGKFILSLYIILTLIYTVQYLDEIFYKMP